MAKLKLQTVTPKRRRMPNWRRRVGCRKSKPNPIYSPPVKIILQLGEEEIVKDQFERDQADFCRNWGPYISVYRKYEEKVTNLEKKLKEAQEDTEFWNWRTEELESHLQNVLVQHQPQTAEEGFGESDEVTSQCSSSGQSGVDRWRCRLCAEIEACVAVLPCSHLCLCFDCAVDFEVDKCPICDAHKIEDLFVRTC